MEIRFQVPSAAVEKSIREEFARGYRVEETERSKTRLGLLDTFDWRIVRSGHRLFAWNRDGAIYLGLHGAGGWLQQPLAVEKVPKFEWDLGQWDLHGTLKSWIKMRRLTERVELDLQWVRYAVLDNEGKQRLRFRF